MAKNKGKGGKNHKRGKNESGDEDEKRELVLKTDGQDYAQVHQMLGNGRCEATCADGATKRLCHIRGNMHNKVWIAAGDVILVSLREYQDDKADVIHKYTPDEVSFLRKHKHLPDNNLGLNDDDDSLVGFEDV